MKIDYDKVSTSGMIIIATGLIWLLWDVVAYFGDFPTLSREITNFSYYSPLAPFVIGFLCGHWFFPVKVDK